MRTTLIALVALILAAVTTSCVSRIGDFTMLTTKNVGNKIDLSQAKHMGEFSGYDSKPIILGFPTGLPNAEEAVDRALAEGQGQVMTDAVVHWRYTDLLFFGEYRLTVTGEVWQIPGMPIPTKPEKRPARTKRRSTSGYRYERP